MLNKLAIPVAVIYTLVLITLSLVRVNNMPSFGTDYDDKFYHLAAYFILMVLWYFAVGSGSGKKRILNIALACIVFGIVIEAIQGKLIVNRVGDLLDALANIVGTIIATFVVLNREKNLS
ncbi:MAG: VanZ family protein [Bacteroidia bacterium]|nr:VanZ family protein [Bacteroidia bacterium]NND24988.1 VanZ family protein [Flavobacteriaceae bacterium]MBT8278592.1 VanZ family protein [Bacteroidia bacterium]NNK59514.1 VanZ family protein [Flavobacteriaceae bacterium]NNL32618.1 VanZ family protein [Flavobacteriaceae bacterium]